MNLREGLAIGLDVVGAPEHERDRLRILAAVVLHLAVQEAVDDRPGLFFIAQNLKNLCRLDPK